MDFKTGKLHKIIREFKKGNGRYEINGIDLENTVFLYREKTSPFIPIPKGNYRTVSDGNENTLIVDDYINNKAVEFQIISIFNVQASKYLEKFPELSMAVEHTNKIVDDINNIIDYLNSVGVKTDSKYQTQILTPLEPSSTWYMNADGFIETLPLDDFNKKFKEIIENISETADEKAQEQVRKRLETLKEEIENFKNTKTSEILENITKKENDSLKEIRKIRDIAKNEINIGVSSINETSSEVLENIKSKKENYISEITTISNNSKKELESKMPEINNKFNSIAGGQLNPSFIQDVGEKRTGQFYLDRNTGRLFKCKKTTSTTINSIEYFEDMSLIGFSEKIANLHSVKTYSYNNTDDVSSSTFLSYKITKIGNLAILEIKFARPQGENILMPGIEIPLEFRPKEDLFISSIHDVNSPTMAYYWIKLTKNGFFYTHNQVSNVLRNLYSTAVYEVVN